MSWTIYAILIIFGLFIILMIVNPNLSCFGRRIRSPFYPVVRKRKIKAAAKDYKLDLSPGEQTSKKQPDPEVKKKLEDEYGFKLD
ncbi:MAG: hypothetical protein H5U07_00780 [Candidatus Aminicenantes bacterium]|nr:hypothetical protein [Candidatus Aminicenantes bacterium]